MVIERILRENAIPGERLLAFGDGYVEIENTKGVGGLAVAVASDEAHNGSGQMDAWKRQRLLGVGADVVIPDYRDAAAAVGLHLRGRRCGTMSWSQPPLDLQPRAGLSAGRAAEPALVPTRSSSIPAAARRRWRRQLAAAVDEVARRSAPRGSGAPRSCSSTEPICCATARPGSSTA